MADKNERDISRLQIKIDNLDVTELQGYTTGATEFFLREDGTFASPGPKRAQILAKISLRV
jgi:hypothetical protein